jgi:hypothetical protein
MNTKNVYIRKGNIVLIESQEIQTFKDFNDAWTFATLLSQLVASSGIESIVFTQGGTWITDNASKACACGVDNDDAHGLFAHNCIPF